MVHIPVLLDKAIDFLRCEPGRVYVDVTLGDGGHAEAILEKSSPSGILIGIDRDGDSIKYAQERLSLYQKRTILFHENFRNIKNVVTARAEFPKLAPLCLKTGPAPCSDRGVDGILFDLGVSTRQLMTAERGFSFSKDAPLDMRMDRSVGVTASEIINNKSERELRDIIWRYGEERRAKEIARTIVRERSGSPIMTTSQLSNIVVSAIPPVYRSKRIHPATKTFQAVRIAVNSEIEILEGAIRDAVDILNAGGRICVISYHSLEDRIVKNLFRELERGCICPPNIPQCVCGKKGIIKILTKRPVTPSEEEIKRNPRSRSAKLRAAERMKN